MLGGMARFKVVYNKTKDEVSFKDVEFWPTITYITDGYQRYGTYALKDYTNELAATHTPVSYTHLSSFCFSSALSCFCGGLACAIHRNGTFRQCAFFEKGSTVGN